MLKQIKKYYRNGKTFLNDPFHIEANKLNIKEIHKQPLRTDVINYLINFLGNKITYLEIGVRNPDQNFNLVNADIKYSVDPGIEFSENPVDFKLTSDDFFNQLREGIILDKDIRFDVIFIDGLHLAEQVDRDINNALYFINENGFIVLHDCNPPSEYHAREEFLYGISPAMDIWNGTSWKAFYKTRLRNDIYSCCIDTDWGVGIISKSINLGNFSKVSNPYYEFKVFEANRTDSLNLMSFDAFKNHITNPSLGTVKKSV
jgi:hypothetical protein